MARVGAPGVESPGSVFLTGIGFAVLLALIGAVPAALRAGRLSIVDALAMR